MAKGDKKKLQRTVDASLGKAQTHLDDVRSNVIAPTTYKMSENYDRAIGEQMGDYRNIMDQYRNFQASDATKPVTFDRVNYNRSPELQQALSSYSNFANTGGFSEADLGNMRARGISPIRSVYANAMNELARQKNLQGGYSPNMAAAMTRMRGSTSQQIADQVQNVNAELARMVQEGKLKGTEGLGNLSVQDLSMAQQAALANQRAGLDAASLNRNTVDPMRLAAIQGQASLYASRPGMVDMFGNQVLQSQQNWLDTERQQQNLANSRIAGQQAVAQTPSNFETGLGRVGQIANIGSAIVNPFMGLPKAAQSVMGHIGKNNLSLYGGF